MNYIVTFGIILSITFVGELLHSLLPLPVPTSIYGLLIMLLCLKLRLVKLEKIKPTVDFLLEIMPMLFIPAAVGLLVVWKQLSSILLPVSVITFLTTVIVMAVTGRATQFFIHRKKGQAEGGDVYEEHSV